MVRAWRFANAAACRAVSNPAWCTIFVVLSCEKSCFPPVNTGTLFQCCVLGQGTLSSHASFDSGANQYFVREIMQCV